MRVLLIKKEKEPREMIAFCLESQFDGEVVQATSTEEAFNMLLDEAELHLIICDDDSKNEKIFKYLASLGAKIPCIVIRPASVGAALAFPDVIIGVVDPANLVENLRQALIDSIRNGKIQMGESVSDYVRVKTMLLTRIHPLNADIYVRLSNVKFVRVFRKGDTFTAQDLESYLVKKKVEYLYVNKEDANTLMEGFKKDLSALMKNPNLSIEAEAPVTQAIHEAVAELGNTLGFTPEVQQIAREGIMLSLKAIGTNPNLKKILGLLNVDKEKYISSHSMMTARISCCLAAAMNWPSGATYQKLAFAAFFHDINLRNQTLARIKTIEELEAKKNLFTPEEINQYRNHPATIATLMTKFTEVPPDVDTIIAQHHERSDGSGFPRKLTGSYIAPLTCVFIIGHDIVDHVFETGGKPDIQAFLEEYKKLNHSGNFRKTLQAIDLSKAGL